jgi:DNA-binding NarL/FixJ family response regulator
MTITVFLADDHAIVRDGLRAFLCAQPDIQVVGEASNGSDALRRIVELGPDVAILDIAMSELSGIDITWQIRQAAPETRIVILSMHAADNLIFEALQAGAHAYLLKESAGAELVRAVRTIHAGHRYLSQKVADKVIDNFVIHHGTVGARCPLMQLSHREREVLLLVVEGKSSTEIADILSLSPKTIATYRNRLMQKLGISDLPTLVKFAIRHRLTPLE